MRLSSFVHKVSKDAVIDGVRNIKRHNIILNKIISEKNPLILNASKSVFKHGNVNIPYRIPQTKINTFLAASSLSHMLDGWMYLSNAFNAILNGDEGTAIHLAYYAELRSAMSILATEGIGVFNNKHIGVFPNGKNSEFPTNYFKGTPPTTSYKQPVTPTHVFVWEAMDKWANSAYKPDSDILKIFKVKGKDFYELNEYFHPSTAVSTLLSVQTIKQWLKDWCFDIRSYKNDRESRNEMSYRPQRIRNFNQNIDFQSILNNLNSFWTVISPLATDKFNLLDSYLLRKLYSGLFVSINNPTLIRRDLIENAFTQHGIIDNTLFSFLNFENPFAGDHIIFQQAALKETTPLSIIARSTLLLRMSVGLVSQLYSLGGIKKNDLNFIWNNYGIDCGFWNNGSIPGDFNKLWSDIETSLNDLNSDINSAGADTDIYSILKRNANEIHHFGQINRAGLWGLDF